MGAGDGLGGAQANGTVSEGNQRGQRGGRGQRVGAGRSSDS